MKTVFFYFFAFAVGAWAQFAPNNHNQKLWTTPTVGCDLLTSSPFSRASCYAESGPVSLTGSMIRSEGRSFGTLTTGWVFKPKEESEVEKYVEPFFGTAITKEEIRSVFGERALYSSKKWRFESWVSKYPGKQGWTNCEPLMDAMRGVGKGIYIGVASSCYFGQEKQQGEQEKLRQIFVGPALRYRHGKLEAGVSVEKGFGNKAKNYPAAFVAYIF